MPKQSDEDKEMGRATLDVVKEEAKRQGRSLRSLSLAVAPNSPNMLTDWSQKGRVPMLSTFMQLSRELGVPAHEMMYRVERRMEQP